MRTAAIVGGGIGGLATAAALVRRGWDVRVYEQSPEFGEVGAGISLWSNALSALDSLGVGDQVRAAGGHPGKGGFRDRAGRWLVRGTGSDDEVVMLHRADLLAILRAAVPAECLVPGTRIDDPRVEDGRPVVDSTPVDLLVGADGIRSRVRAVFWPDAPAPRPAGYTAWRMVVPHAGIPAFDGSETWGDGLVFGVFPMGEDTVYCYASSAQTAPVDDELALLRRRFAGWPDPIPAVLAAADPGAVLRHDLYYQPDLPSFARGPVALVGDAAHAMTPNLGQGACQALEDAVTLAAHAHEPDGLARYDAVRRPRAQGIVKRSRQVGAMVHRRRGQALRNLVVRATPPIVMRRQLQSVAGWTAPGQSPA
ncbi:FAD-dependent oxidoreductase [Actinokineospora fastidiosa]|uniref:Monooxygenase n=1 Tax=Actinokineospora fastidiosa TaxID=1816 RepID=A0A918LGD0_9PSEU|nr:FAD-dependent oxidoreductase [Actinokineospora fastidiosa]GGS43478.1 monooxygenase [Actinokineospora fastidiosa]